MVKISMSVGCSSSIGRPICLLPLSDPHLTFQHVEKPRSVSGTEWLSAAGHVERIGGTKISHQVAHRQGLPNAGLGERVTVMIDGSSTGFDDPIGKNDISCHANIARLDALGDPHIRRIRACRNGDDFDHGIAAGSDPTIRNEANLQSVPLGDANGLRLNRAGIGINVNDDHE